MPNPRRSARPIQCQYCGKAVVTVGALESHMTQKAECAERRREDLRRFSEEVARLQHSLDRSTNSSNPGATPSSPIRNKPVDVIDVEMDDIELGDAEPVGHHPNVTIEEVEDEDAPHIPVRSCLDLELTLMLRFFAVGTPPIC
jgi:hypothetical protein